MNRQFLMDQLLRLQEEDRKSVIIKPMKTKDVKVLKHMYKEFGKDTISKHQFKTEDMTWEKRVKRWKKMESEGKFIIHVAWDRGIPIGWCIGNVKKPTNVGYIIELFLKREYRGGELSEQLFKGVVDFLHKNGGKVIRLYVLGSNRRARSFYKKMGLIEEKVIYRDKASKGVIPKSPY